MKSDNKFYTKCTLKYTHTFVQSSQKQIKSALYLLLCTELYYFIFFTCVNNVKNLTSNKIMRLRSDVIFLKIRLNQSQTSLRISGMFNCPSAFCLMN